MRTWVKATLGAVVLFAVAFMALAAWRLSAAEARLRRGQV